MQVSSGILLSWGNEFLWSHLYSGPLAAADISICNSGLASQSLRQGGGRGSAAGKVHDNSYPTISPFAKARRRGKHFLLCNNPNFGLKCSFCAELESRWLLPGAELPDLTMAKPSCLIS